MRTSSRTPRPQRRLHRLLAAVARLFKRSPGSPGAAGDRGCSTDHSYAAVQGLSVDIATLTDVGCHRTLNEDAVLWSLPEPGSPSAEKGALLVVADGMGGAAGGDVAGRMAVDEVSEAYYAGSGSLEEAVREAGARIFELAAERPELSGMGSTCVALALRNGHAFAAYVGDSRVYLVRDGGIYQMTEDHSYVSEMVQAGVLTREEARTHEERNVISRALGTSASVEVASWDRPFALRPGDRLILSTDGLHDLVDDDEILAVVERRSASASCQQLVEMARTRGGYDNITVAVAAFGREPAPSLAPGVETREYGVHQ